MVVCPECGEEYSLGRTIYHNCEGFSIQHGVICCGPCESHSWNCNCTERNDISELEKNFKNTIKKLENTLKLLKASYQLLFP